MRPAFSSSRQTISFALLLALLLALPLLIGRGSLTQRREVYPAIPWKYGAFPWIQKKVFTETSDVDIAFIGSSRIWTDIDAPYVQKKLSEQLGRQSEVFTLGWNWSGYDALYIIARDLLANRHVHTLVIYDEGGAPHSQSHRWFRMGKGSESLEGLPWSAQIGLYGSAVLGMPRQLLSWARLDRLEDPSRWRDNEFYADLGVDDLSRRLGSHRARAGINRSPRNFLQYTPPSAATSDDVVIYSTKTLSAFAFTGPHAEAYELHFARKLARLCQATGTQLVALHLPVMADMNEVVISERMPWHERLAAPVAFAGIPGSKLFAQIPPSELPKLFYDKNHFNQNGQDLFTPLITPALLKIYATAPDRY